MIPYILVSSCPDTSFQVTLAQEETCRRVLAEVWEEVFEVRWGVSPVMTFPLIVFRGVSRRERG